MGGGVVVVVVVVVVVRDRGRGRDFIFSRLLILNLVDIFMIFCKQY